MSNDGLMLRKEYADIVAALLADLSLGAGGRVAITDATPGSVLLTLVEAFSRELAVAYAQLERVYRLGYIDTAEGEALDQVVALVGLTRRGAGHLEGTVTFSRAAPAPATIAIPAGTRVAGLKMPLVETIAAVSLTRGRTEVTVGVVTVGASVGPVPANTLDTLPEPLFGIESVSNRVGLVCRSQPETDAELRERTRRRIEAVRTGTAVAVEQAVRARGYTQVLIEEPPGRPGVIEVIVGDDSFDEHAREQLRTELECVRPAGIQLDLGGVEWVGLEIVARLEMARPLDPPRQQALVGTLEPRLSAYIAGLGPRESVRDAKLTGMLANHDDVGGVLELKVTPRARKDGEYIEDGARVRTNRDVLIGPRERARVDRITITFEQPTPVVWLDVLFQARDQAVVDVPQLRRAIDQHLSGSLSATLAWKDLWDALSLPTQACIAAFRLIALHERDGLVTELGRDGDEDLLDPREVVHLRTLEREGAS